jgi:hypothetical protein
VQMVPRTMLVLNICLDNDAVKFAKKKIDRVETAWTLPAPSALFGFAYLFTSFSLLVYYSLTTCKNSIPS